MKKIYYRRFFQPEAVPQVIIYILFFSMFTVMGLAGISSVTKDDMFNRLIISNDINKIVAYFLTLFIFSFFIVLPIFVVLITLEASKSYFEISSYGFKFKEFESKQLKELPWEDVMEIKIDSISSGNAIYYYFIFVIKHNSDTLVTRNYEARLFDISELFMIALNQNIIDKIKLLKIKTNLYDFLINYTDSIQSKMRILSIVVLFLIGIFWLNLFYYPFITAVDLGSKIFLFFLISFLIAVIIVTASREIRIIYYSKRVESIYLMFKDA